MLSCRESGLKVNFSSASFKGQATSCRVHFAFLVQLGPGDWVGKGFKGSGHSCPTWDTLMGIVSLRILCQGGKGFVNPTS